MLRLSAGQRTARLPRGGPDPRRVRLLALLGAVACALLLPLAVASAGPVPDRGGSPAGPMADGGGSAVRRGAQGPVRVSAYDSSAGGSSGVPHDDQKPSSAGTDGPRRLLGIGSAPAVRCGPELSSPEGVEAQTCVLTLGGDTWARTYYRNVTGRALDSDLSLMGPGGRTVRTRCVAGADDEPDTCETPRERSRGGLDAYVAVAEFAARGEAGPLLLRSGSNSGAHSGS